MRFKSGLVIGAAIGFAAARWLAKEDPEVVSGPRNAGPSQNPASRILSDQGRRMAERAQLATLGALQRARTSIRSRLQEPGDVVDLTEADTRWN
jgi:hypothetical protein